MSNIFTMCFVEKNNQILLQKRASKLNKEFWEAPRGKVELFESPVEACVRKIKKEIGIDIDNLNFRGILTITKTNRKSNDVLMLFHSKDQKGFLFNNNDEDIIWVEIDKVYSHNITSECFTYLLPYIIESNTIYTGKAVYDRKQLKSFEISQ